ncbi:hypothetical protein JYK21_13545 [Ralstonia pickettii]|nr:hypothetical protein [Ralstonia pickettii]
MLASAKANDVLTATGAAAAMSALPKPARGDRVKARKLNEEGLAANEAEWAIVVRFRPTAAVPLIEWRSRTERISMEIERLITLEKGASLADVVGHIDPMAFLGKSLYRVGEGVYLQASQFKDLALTHNPNAPFVTGVLFTPDDGAARRISVLAIEEDQGAPLMAPPGVLPEGSACSYAAILAALKRAEPKVCLETASYRIATDGKFVHRTIETELYTFYFRASKHSDLEQPYALLYKLQPSGRVGQSK